MTSVSAPSLRSALRDREAAIYYGHLMAQAESAVGSEFNQPYSSMALTWIAGDCISRGGRYHQFLFEDIQMAGRQIGAWKLEIRVFPTKHTPIELYRKNFLEAEGVVATSPAAALISEVKNSEKLDAFCVSQLALDCMHLGKSRKSYEIRDSRGHMVKATISRPILRRTRGRVLSLIRRQPLANLGI